jgi:putative transposase
MSTTLVKITMSQSNNLYQSLTHSKWNCKYHIVFIPKKRKKILFINIRKQIGEVFRELAQQKECEILEGSIMSDHVHMCISIPPKHAVSSIIGFMKGKSAIAIARMQGRQRNFTGAHFWARGYAVSTVGFEQEQVRRYIKEQETNDERGILF